MLAAAEPAAHAEPAVHAVPAMLAQRGSELVPAAHAGSSLTA